MKSLGILFFDAIAMLDYNEVFAPKAGIEKVDSLVREIAGNGTQQAWLAFRQTESIINTVDVIEGERSLSFNLNLIRDSLKDRSVITISLQRYQSHAFNIPLGSLVTTGSGAGEPILIREFNLTKAQLGTTLIQEEVKRRDPEHDAGSRTNNSHDGDIGSGLLKDYEVIFDYQYHAISIRKVNKT